MQRGAELLATGEALAIRAFWHAADQLITLPTEGTEASEFLVVLVLATIPALLVVELHGSITRFAIPQVSYRNGRVWLGGGFASVATSMAMLDAMERPSTKTWHLDTQRFGIGAFVIVATATAAIASIVGGDCYLQRMLRVAGGTFVVWWWRWEETRVGDINHVVHVFDNGLGFFYELSSLLLTLRKYTRQDDSGDFVCYFFAFCGIKEFIVNGEGVVACRLGVLLIKLSDVLLETRETNGGIR